MNLNMHVLHTEKLSEMINMLFYLTAQTSFLLHNNIKSLQTSQQLKLQPMWQQHNRLPHKWRRILLHHNNQHQYKVEVFNNLHKRWAVPEYRHQQLYHFNNNLLDICLQPSLLVLICNHLVLLLFNNKHHHHQMFRKEYLVKSVQIWLFVDLWAWRLEEDPVQVRVNRPQAHHQVEAAEPSDLIQFCQRSQLSTVRKE